MKEVFRDYGQRFFFAPAGPSNLAVCRILFYGAMLGYYGGVDFSPWGTVSDVFWSAPWKTPWHLPLPVFPEAVIGILQNVWMAALFLSCVGLCTRWSTRIAFILGIYLLGLPVQFGQISHAHPLPILIFLLLMFARCGDAWSGDSWLRRRRRIVVPHRSGEYTWPIRMVWVMFTLVFFAAGFAKLRDSGLAWVFSDNLSRRLLLAPDYFQVPWLLTNESLAVGRQEWLCRLLAGMTLVLEVGYPLTLVSRRSRWFFVPGTIAMQVGILFLMGPNFLPFILCNLFWVPWDRILLRVPATYQEQVSESPTESRAVRAA